jgi:hypothetical protein
MIFRSRPGGDTMRLGKSSCRVASVPSRRHIRRLGDDERRVGVYSAQGDCVDIFASQGFGRHHCRAPHHRGRLLHRGRSPPLHRRSPNHRRRSHHHECRCPHHRAICSQIRAYGIPSGVLDRSGGGATECRLDIPRTAPLGKVRE